MSSDREARIEDKLVLPVYQSPQELDERILAFAQSNLPARAETARSWWSFFLHPKKTAMSADPRYTSKQWMGGLVAASIVGVALIITPLWQAQETSQEFHSAKDSSLKTVSTQEPSKAMEHEEDVVDLTTFEMGIQALSEPLERERDFAGLTPDERAFVQHTLALAQNSSSKFTLGAIADKVAGAIADKLDATVSYGAIAGGAIHPTAQNIEPGKSQLFSETYVQPYIAILARLIEGGHDELANIYYEKLLLACPQCGLPDQLSDAVAKMLTQD